MPREIRELAEQLLQKPAIVELAHSMPAETIRHTLFWVEHETKLDLLCYLLEEDGCTSAIVFTRTRHRARRLARTLEKNKYRAVALHGDLSQSARDRAMDRFRSCSPPPHCFVQPDHSCQSDQRQSWVQMFRIHLKLGFSQNPVNQDFGISFLPAHLGVGGSARTLSQRGA